MARLFRPRFVSGGFVAGFGIGVFAGVALALLAVSMARDERVVQPPLAVLVTATPPPPPPATASATPSPTAIPPVRTNSTINVRLGPGNAFAIIGSLSRGEVVEVIGRDADGEWVAIAFPPGSAARGWLQSQLLEGLSTTSLDDLAVLGPTPLPRASTPSAGGATNGAGGSGVTSTPAPFLPTPFGPPFGATATPSPTTAPGSTAPPAGQTATPTPTPPRTGPTDLTVVRVSLLSDGRVNVVIGNQGPGDVRGQPIFVRVQNLQSDGETLIVYDELRVGETMSLQTTTFRVAHEQDVIAEVDPGAIHNDPNRGNNRLTVVLAPAPSATPLPTTPPF